MTEKEKRVAISVSVNPSLLNAADRFSENNYCSRSQTVRNALVEFLGKSNTALFDGGVQAVIQWPPETTEISQDQRSMVGL